MRPTWEPTAGRREGAKGQASESVEGPILVLGSVQTGNISEIETHSEQTTFALVSQPVLLAPVPQYEDVLSERRQWIQRHGAIATFGPFQTLFNICNHYSIILSSFCHIFTEQQCSALL